MFVLRTISVPNLFSKELNRFSCLRTARGVRWLAGRLVHSGSANGRAHRGYEGSQLRIDLFLVTLFAIFSASLFRGDYDTLSSILHKKFRFR